MMQTSRNMRRIGALLMLLSACDKGQDGTKAEGTKPEPAKSAGKDIVIGVIADLTGATADVGRPYNEGMLAYVDGEVAGWCGFGPRHRLPRLERSRTIPKVDDVAVWSILCFNIRVGYRRRGVASADRTLAEGAVG